MLHCNEFVFETTEDVKQEKKYLGVMQCSVPSTRGNRWWCLLKACDTGLHG